IAQIDPSRYAFFRGQTPLAVPPPQPAQQDKASAKQRRKAGGSLKGQLLKGLQEQNVDFQREQVEQLKEMYDAAPAQMGVEAQKAF
ncbi:MAG: hypothetical protein ACYSWU_23050, partial [Planctomycetota bacterium]